MGWFLFNSNENIIKRLNKSINECEKAIEAYKKSNLFEKELQERWTLNILKYIKSGNFTEYMNEKVNINRDQLYNKYKSKKE